MLVYNTNDSGAGSLRAAITYADASGGTIIFDLDPNSDPNYDPSTGSFTIHPTSALPTVDDGVSIDGTSQPGYAGTPIIVISGDQAGNYIDGLDIDGSDDTIQGLVIDNFDGIGVFVTGNNDIIQDNYIGTDVTGTLAAPNQAPGLYLAGSNNDIVDANLISGNGNGGIVINGASGNSIYNNLIGTAVGGADLSNHGVGVLIYGGATGNTIGGDSAGAGNTIAYNTVGVQVGLNASDAGTDGNAIEGNSIFGNTNIGISLGGSSFVANESESHTNTPNLFQDYPAVTSAQIDASGDLLVSFPNPTDPYSYTPVTVDFYLADAQGQGMTYLGSNTTAGGTVSLGLAANIGVSLGDSIVATATDAHGNTSEFSPAVTVTAASNPLVVTNTNDSGAGSLRAAITYADNNGGGTISFAIPRGDSGYSLATGSFLIQPLTALPDITSGVSIDGTSEAAFLGETYTSPIIVLNGAYGGKLPRGSLRHRPDPDGFGQHHSGAGRQPV